MLGYRVRCSYLGVNPGVRNRSSRAEQIRYCRAGYFCLEELKAVPVSRTQIACARQESLKCAK